MTTTFEKEVNEFVELVKGFKYQEAHDKFYSDALVKHENENAPTISLEAHRTEMENFLASITDYSAELCSLIISDNMSVVEWNYKFKHKEWGDRDFMEISTQRWKDGKIIHERHHYKTESW
ncbi:MAG: ester cyclase [Bacteroidia bacterium]|nr:ester cyclase [Bacteroidia bacterium]